jgi:hypothetical protein
VALSPEGRWLAYSDQDEGIVLVDARSGRSTGRAGTGVYYQALAPQKSLRDVLAFSPDGKTVAWSGVESTADIFLIEARSHQIRRRLHGDSSPVRHLVFSPDGRRLLSTGPEGSALVWDVYGPRPSEASSLPAAAPPSRWWDALADPSAGKAYQTMQEMAAHPRAALTLLREKLKPVEPVNADRLAQLLAGLGADTFRGREKASAELVALADAVEPALRAAAEKSADREMQWRARETLERIDAGRLRAERAVEVLEMIGDGDARKLLQELAGGLPGARLTTDAAGAAARLARVESRGQ